MKKLIVITFLVVAMSFALFGCDSATETIPTTTVPEGGTATQPSDIIQQQNDTIAELRQQIDNLETDISQLQGVEQNRQAISQDLFNRPELIPELIPIEPRRPTQPFFFTDVFILDARYVAAVGEDGYFAFIMILRYYENEDDSIDWEIIAYEYGEGFVLVE